MAPIVAQVENWIVPYILRNILDQAQSRGRTRQVAKGLFAAKLEILFKRKLRDEEVPSVSTTGDFHVGDTTIVLAIGLPVGAVVAQVKQLLRGEHGIVWLIDRQHESSKWEDVLNVCLKPKLRDRVVVGEIETNIGLMIMMMAGCEFEKERELFWELIQRYNDKQSAEGEYWPNIVIQNANVRTL